MFYSLTVSKLVPPYQSSIESHSGLKGEIPEKMSPKICQLAKENLARTSHFLHFEITHKIKVVKNSKFTSLRELCKVHLFLQILEEMSNSWYFMKIKICILCMCFQKFE